MAVRQKTEKKAREPGGDSVASRKKGPVAPPPPEVPARRLEVKVVECFHEAKSNREREVS